MQFTYLSSLWGTAGRLWSSLFLCLFATGVLLAQGITTKRNYIRTDQFGYLPNAKKVAVIANAQTGFNSAYGINLNVNANVELRRASDNAVVKSSRATAWNGGATDGYSGDKGWWWDFTDYTTPGSYYIRVTETNGNTVNSNRFDIGGDVYNTVLQKATQFFYYQRCDTDKPAQYGSGGNWTDTKWYTQDQNTRFLYDESQTRDLRGGWIDAGDPNKYVTFATPVVHNLLTTYHEHPDLWNAVDLNIPESNNSVPDLLDEVKFEIDWLRRMQYADGAVIQKMGVKTDAYVSPTSDDTRTRFFNGTCPNATIMAAGMFAHAAKTFSDAGVFGGQISDLTTRAENAWNYYSSSSQKDAECDTREIKAGDADGGDVDPDGPNGPLPPKGHYSLEHQAEAAVAAVYLYALTGKTVYHNYFKNNYQRLRPFTESGNSEWAEYRVNQGEALIYYLSLPTSTTDATVRNNIINLKTSSLKSSGSYYSVVESDNLYRARAFFLAWGSNSLMSRNGSQNYDFIKYGLNTGSHGNYRERGQSIVNYMHGVNPFGMTYLSTMYDYGAEYCADEMWHTWFGFNQWDGTAGSNVGPAPGILSGGAQTGSWYLPMKVGTNTFNTGTNSQPNQKRWSVENEYAPDRQPWAFNEPALYYQASYVKLLADVIADGGSTPTNPPPGGGDGEVIGEVGSSSTNQNWKTVNLSNSYTNPVVIMGGLGMYGGQAATTRVRNVTANSFQWRVDEWEYLDEGHNAETVAYMVVEAGRHTLDNGFVLEAGNTEVRNALKNVPFSEDFGEAVTVFCSVNTENEAQAVNVRVRNITSAKFDMELQEEENGGTGNGSRAHVDETVGWVAITRGDSGGSGTEKMEVANTGNSVTEKNYTINFRQSYGSNRRLFFHQQTRDGADAAIVRHRHTSGTGSSSVVFIQEEQSKDTELGHTTEVVGRMIFDGSGDLIAQGGSNPPPPPTGGTSNEFIYREALASGWGNWSWNGSTTTNDGLSKNGSFALKFLADAGDAGFSPRHDSGRPGSGLNSIKFWIRSFNSNFTSGFNVRVADEGDGPYTFINVTPSYQEVTISAADLGNPSTIRRLVWTVPNTKTIYLDDVRIVYNTSSRGTLTQEVDGEQLFGALTPAPAAPAMDLYPNPNGGLFTVNLSVPTDTEASLELFDMTGRRVDVTRTALLGGHNRMQLDYRDSGVTPGVYLLRVSSPDGTLRLTERVSIR